MALVYILFFFLQLLVPSVLGSPSIAAASIQAAGSSLIKKQYPNFFEIEQKFGNQRTMLTLQGVMPLYGQARSLFFISPVANATLAGALDGALGVGYRHHCTKPIIGFWGYFSIGKTANNFLFSQWSLGGECVFSSMWFALNGYFFPRKKHILIEKHHAVEIAMEGFDLVGGFSLPTMRWKGWLSYAYFFNSTYYSGGVHSGQMKMQYDLTDWLGIHVIYGYNTLHQHDASIGISLNNAFLHRNEKHIDMHRKMIQIPIRPSVGKTFFVKHSPPPSKIPSEDKTKSVSSSDHSESGNNVPGGGSSNGFGGGGGGSSNGFRGDGGGSDNDFGGGGGGSSNGFGKNITLNWLPDKVKNIFNSYSSYCSTLRERADKDRGIISSYSGLWYMRDATNQGDRSSTYSSGDYQSSMISLCRAADLICHMKAEETNEEKTKADIEKIVKEIRNDFEKLKEEYTENKDQNEDYWEESMKTNYHKMVQNLKKCFVANKEYSNEDLENVIGQMLRTAEGFCVLRDRHYDIETKFKVANKTFIQRDERVFANKLPDSKIFENRANYEWYKKSTSFEQKLMDLFHPALTDGQHITPYSFRSMPSLKNAYKRTILMLDENNKPKKLGSYYHSGMLTLFPRSDETKYQEEIKKIEKANWEQVKKQEPNMIFISLNSNGISQKDENYIVTRTKEIVESNSFMNIPINFFRRFSTTDYGTSLKNFFSSVKKSSRYAKYLKDSKEEIKQKIESDTTDESERQDLRFVKEFQELQENTKQPEQSQNSEQEVTILEISKNKNARNAAQFIALSSVGREKEKDLFPPVMFACKSGKDRTGYVSWLADADIIKLHCPRINRDLLYDGLASAGHIQYLAACNGGLPGRFGFKPVATDFYKQLENNDDKERKFVQKVHKKLFRKSALHTNTVYKKEPNIFDLFKKCITKWFANRTIGV